MPHLCDSLRGHSLAMIFNVININRQYNYVNLESIPHIEYLYRQMVERGNRVKEA